MDLTTLAKVKDWCKIKSTDIDSLLEDLITSTSEYLIEEVGFYALLPTAYTEFHSGRGLTALYPQHRPIISVTSVSVNGTTVPARTTSTGMGYAFDDDAIYFAGYLLPVGFRNIQIDIVSGYDISHPIWSMLEENVLKMINKTLDRRNHPDQQFQHSGTQIITRFNNDDLSPEVKRFINHMRDRVQVIF